MRKKVVRVVPADPRPESIANLLTVVEIVGNRGMGHADVKTYHFEGTVEEKLQQYREYFGKEWPGTSEQTFTSYEEREPVSLNLGQKDNLELRGKRISREAQEKVDALVEEARATLRWSEEMKKTWPERKKKALRATKKEKAEALR